MTIDFTEFKKEQDAAKAAYDVERFFTGRMSVEEFDALVARSLEFHGERLNKKNLERYEQIKDRLYALMEIHGAIKASEESPSKDRCYANLHLYVSGTNCYGTQVKNLKPFIEAIQLADEFTISFAENDPEAVKLTWTVYNIYEE